MKLNTGVVMLATILILLAGARDASAMYADTRFEAPSSGYEGTYEWRGVMANTYVYPWVLPQSGGSGPGEHVSSVFIHHPRFPGTDGWRFMEIGVDRMSVFTPTVFTSYCNSATDPSQIQTIDWTYVSVNTTQKLVIRNMTMGDVNTGWQRWIMSLNDVILWDQLHPLTYGQAWTSSETWYLGNDNRAYFGGMKRTSRPANWVYWTESAVRLNQDTYYDFSVVSDTAWYNVP